MKEVPVAALYVAMNGVYWDLLGVDAWDEHRDARQYSGPYPVVAHPPCARWGRYWSGGPSAKVRRIKGDDGGCFAAALAAVRKYGGVLEHPEGSHAWEHFGIVRPPRGGGWVQADSCRGFTCCVEQGHYGHPARKATWLYALGCTLPSLTWGPAQPEQRPILKGNSTCRPRRPINNGVLERMSKRQRISTPPVFRDVLLAMARSATGVAT